MSRARKKNRIVAIILSIMIGLAMSPNISFADDQTVAMVGDTQFTTLQAAITAVADGTAKGNVKLTADVTEGVVIPAGKYIVLDLNGHEITNAAGKHTIENNGILKLRSTGGTATIDNITKAKACIMNNIGGVATVSGDINIIRSQVQPTGETASWYNICNRGTMTINEGVYIENKGTGQTTVTTGFLDVEELFPEVPDCKLTINGGTIKGGVNCIKVDSAGVLEMNGGELINENRPAIINWNVATINGGTITAFQGVVLGKHTWPEGDAPSEPTEKGITIINGGTFTCSNAIFTKTGSSANEAGAVVTINGGTFNGPIPPKTFLDKATIEVYGGDFDRDVSDVVDFADDRVLVPGEDDVFRVKTFSENDQEKVDAVTQMINDLPRVADLTLEHEADVNAASAAYGQLTPVQQALISESATEKLDNAVDKIAKINEIKDLIREYLEEIDTSKYPEGLQAAFENELIPNVNARLDTMDTLEEVQEQYNALKAMVAAFDNIYGIDFDLYDESDIGNLQGYQYTAASQIYNAVALDINYYQVDVFETIDIMIDYLDERADGILEDKKAADAVKAKINALPKTENLTLDDGRDVRDADSAYDALQPHQQERIDDATKAALDDAVEKIKELKADKDAADAVTTKIEDLPRTADLTLDNKEAVEDAQKAFEELTKDQQDLISNAVKEKLDNALDKIDELEKQATAEEYLKAVKEEAKGDLDKLLASKKESDYDAEDWTALKKFITDGKAAIDAATTISEVDAAKNAAMNAVAEIKTKTEKEKEALAAEKAKAKDVLDNLLAGKKEAEYDAEDWAALKKAITDGKAAIDAATTIKGVEEAKQAAEEAVGNIRTIVEKAAQTLEEAKAVAKNELDNLLAGKKEADYDAEDWTALKKAITDGKAAIDAATTIDAVYKAKNDAENAVAEIKTKTEKEKEALATEKAKAKDVLDNLLAGKKESDYDAEDWTALKKAITDGKDAIDKATTVEEVEKAKKAAEDAVGKIRTKEQKDREAAEAVRAKINALPRTAKLTLEDKDAVYDAKESYDALTDTQKALISNAEKEKLDNAVARIKELEDANGGEDDPNQMGKDGTPIGEGASEAAADNFITTGNLDKDPKGSKFAPLKLKSSKQGKKNIKLAWTKTKKAAKYVVYGNLCGKARKMKKLTTVKGKTFNVKKIKTAKLKKGKMYKFIVVAIDKNKKVVSTSKVIHVATKGGKICNPKKVTVKAKKGKKWKTIKKVTVKKGKNIKLKAVITKQYKKKKIKPHAGVKGVRYESSNARIAKVNKKGVIKGVKKGSCTVYAYAQNGLYKAIKVKVK